VILPFAALASITFSCLIAFFSACNQRLSRSACDDVKFSQQGKGERERTLSFWILSLDSCFILNISRASSKYACIRSVGRSESKRHSFVSRSLLTVAHRER
jgi:hypothetical protein